MFFTGVRTTNGWAYSVVLIVIICTFLSGPCLAQKAEFVILNAEPVDEHRYRDIKGTPYLFEDWIPASYTGRDGSLVKNIPTNFNGHLKQFEVIKNGQTYPVEESAYVRIDCFDTQNGVVDSITFMRGLYPKNEQYFSALIFRGKRTKLIKYFTVRIDEKVMRDMGREVLLKEFAPKHLYLFHKDEERAYLSIRRKQILTFLGKEEQLEKYLKRKRNKLQTEQELLNLLQYYETLGAK